MLRCQATQSKTDAAMQVDHDGLAAALGESLGGTGSVAAVRLPDAASHALSGVCGWAGADQESTFQDEPVLPSEGEVA